jgi:hypothetical protein
MTKRSKVIRVGEKWVRFFVEKFEPEGKHRDLRGKWRGDGIHMRHLAGDREVAAWIESGETTPENGWILSVQEGGDFGGF